MNLFNPIGQESLAVPSYLYKVVSSDETDRSVDKIRSIFNDQGGKGKIRNADL
jgi:hypothetical protein